MMGMKDMTSRNSGHRSPRPALGSRISYVLLAMFATMASVYVAGRLWIDSESRVHLIKELDQRTDQGQSAVSVDDTLKVVVCRDKHKKLSALEMELVAVRHEGFVSRYSSEGSENGTRKKLLAVIGVATGFGRKNNRMVIFHHCGRCDGVQQGDRVQDRPTAGRARPHRHRCLQRPCTGPCGGGWVA